MPKAPRVIDWFDGTDYEFMSNFYPSRIRVPIELLPAASEFDIELRAKDTLVCVNTVEEAFQALKVRTLKDFWAVLKSQTPGGAKAVGNKIWLRGGWDACTSCGQEISRSGQFHSGPDKPTTTSSNWCGIVGNDHHTLAEVVMYECLRRKFSPINHAGLADLLLDTRDAYLCEGNTWHDQTWGSCQCLKHSLEPGRNLLGRLLMDIRAELQEWVKTGGWAGLNRLKKGGE